MSLIIAILLQIGDGVLTYIGLSRGFEEGNVLARYLILALGPLSALFWAKVCAILGFWLLYKQRRYKLIYAFSVLYTVFAILPWIVLIYG